MGFNVYVINGEEKYYLERNVTYNFSTDNYMKYWYILNDLHKKTVEESIKRLEIVIPELGRVRMIWILFYGFYWDYILN